MASSRIINLFTSSTLGLQSTSNNVGVEVQNRLHLVFQMRRQIKEGNFVVFRKRESKTIRIM